ncbi:MAG: RNA polymerase sigma factor [Planctomycetes bacterium]|nr:RNA polymerase sigma factor [Planctomycetota bacterium]
MATTDAMIQALVRHRVAYGAGSHALPAEHFWQLVERFRADLVNQAFAILGNQPDAEDVAQESLCEAFQELHTLQDAQRLGHWLRQINRRNTLDVLRRRKRRAQQDEAARQQPGVGEPVSGGFSQVDLREIVARAIDTLPDEFREIVVLRYWEGLSYEELGTVLDLPLGTVKSRLARADDLLARKLRKYARPSGDTAAHAPLTPEVSP